MSETQQVPTPTGENESNKPVIIYALYLAGFVTGITPLIGLVLAYVFKSDGTPMQVSHYNHAINIFWKGLLYSIGCFILTFLVIGIFLYIVLAVWMIIRCAKGINLAMKNQPYPDPSSWGF